MITKELRVRIDTRSWGRKPLPSWIDPLLSTDSIDVGRALLMLGSLTTPSGLSPGSPERYWACIRYFSACTSSSDLRVGAPFMDLDPHQKGILSDDFGVAISTAWLVDRLGGAREIVDGRRFMINMGVRKPTSSQRLPKVGTGKCPDFVLEDRAGKLHVLECKGTQSGPGYLSGAMVTGRAQKRGIKVARALRGESLVIGLSLAGEGDDHESVLVVTDPEDEPLSVVRESDAKRAEEVLARLSLARALNLSGFSRTAFELAWPEGLKNDSPEVDLLTPAERKSLSMARGDRQTRWQQELDSEFRSMPRRHVNNFVTQQMSFDLPNLRLDSGAMVNRVTVHRGVQVELLDQLASAGQDLRVAAIDALANLQVMDQPLKFSETEHSSRLDYQGLFYSEVVFE
jgi:hypothetical protein